MTITYEKRSQLPGFRVVSNLGVVRGITVRSRSVFGTLGGSLQTLVGGNISLFTQLCEKAREEAFEIMIQHASEIGANAIMALGTTPTKSWAASPKCWLMVRRSSSNR